MTLSSDRKVIGIDLGTTFSLVAVLLDGKPKLITNVLGEHLTPSAVGLDNDGRILVGAAARARLAAHPDRTAVSFKRDMGTGRKLRLGAQGRSPEELSAYVLAALKTDAEAFLGHGVDEAVITVPAYFGEVQRQATRSAGEIAGLRVERIINEPTAAALAYGLNNRGRELRAVVVDLGGGTFDVTVLEITEGVIEIQSSAGDSRLGGDDFTSALASLLRRRLLTMRLTPAHDAITSARLSEAADLAKHRLSQQSSTRVVVPELALEGGGSRDLELEISREEADEAFALLLARMRSPIERALRDADADAVQMDEVLLVGGATRMPCVVQLCARMFGRMPLRTLPPDEAVAMGAAIQAGLKAGDTAVDDIVVTDVAPFSLGIATVSKLGERMIKGVFSPILERGTVIPASRVERFHTVQDDQRQLEVEVFQGEHAMCHDNTKLGAYTIELLPRGKAGEVEVDVRFTYDLNGLLEVEMTVPGTDRVEQVVLQRPTGRMSALEVKAAREAMARIKFHPRDGLPNRTALSRADALYAELRGDARGALGYQIAQFSAALEAQDPIRIATLRDQLNALATKLAQER